VRSLRDLEAGRVVVAAGVATADLDGLDPALASALRPVKGQILQLRGPRPLLRHVVRLPTAYLVPRDDGRLVVGATVEERGLDTTVTAGAVLELLRRAVEAVPDVAELELVESAAGLRPGTRDNAPVIGELAPGGPIAAFGHYRNGILLAPATAEAVAALAAGEQAPSWAGPFTPTRFAVEEPRAHVDLAQR
jgi:glycine oxidase